jgi:hypothetical protein
MVFHIYNSDYDPPHVDLTADGTMYRFSLYDRNPIGKPMPPAKVSDQVEGWVSNECPWLRKDDQRTSL